MNYENTMEDHVNAASSIEDPFQVESELDDLKLVLIEAEEPVESNKAKANELMCQLCGNVYKDRKYFNRHVKMHKNPPPQQRYKCPKCDLSK